MTKNWYLLKLMGLTTIILILTACSANEDDNSGETKIETETGSKLIFSDEFNDSQTLDTSKWKHETFPPNNGSWWNGEKQHYTSRKENSFLSNGTLKIVAKKETFTFDNSTKDYTSARLNSKFSFTYGRVDVRAKLPAGDGTWPAIWMLGSNITSAGWPACGEIDIMEHWGHQPTIIASATHTPACSGGCTDVTVGKTIIPDYNTAFHVYSIIWNENEIQYLIDDVLKYIYNPAVKNSDNWPFTKSQFIILNVAMGGEWFSIDPDFNESTMEIDYVRVYKN